MAETTDVRGPDLAEGVPAAALALNGTLVGHFMGEEVLLVRQADGVHAVGARCSHYGAPLDQGLLVDGQLRCPWHHAGFCLRSGRAERAPGLTDLASYDVEETEGRVRVVGRRPAPCVQTGKTTPHMVIVGGGAAGSAAAETLRRQGHSGPITMVDADAALPVDRPNLSKDYLAGAAPEEWLYVRDNAFYQRWEVERVCGEATELRISDRVLVVGGEELAYDALLLAPGAEARQLQLPGMQHSHVHTLRSVSDCKRVIATAKLARQAVVIGAGFLGLEVAGALRARGLQVSVIAPEHTPFVAQLGAEIGQAVMRAHEAGGVRFLLGHTVAAIHQETVEITGGGTLPAQLVVVAVGAVPRTTLARQAKLDVATGILVDASLATSAPDVWAAGDAASWWSPQFQTHLRSEHWVTAQRMGQCAAANMLGANEPFDAIPFFWTVHGTLTIHWVGHPVGFDDYEIEGSVGDADCAVTYRSMGQVVAVATIGRDIQSLRAELELERLRHTH